MTTLVSHAFTQAHEFPTDETVRARISDALRKIASYDDPAVWIYRCSDDDVFAQVEYALDRRRDGLAQPLLGLTVAVKDNIDVVGMPTTAGCPDFAYSPVVSATAVRKLSDAGAIIMGKTNLDQFATGLVGTRSPYGACRNIFNRDYISGGSSSGSAVAVAGGLVDFALGTDTAGSGRVPAAFNDIVGLKPTRGMVSTAGVVPACRSLDCVSIFTSTCEMAERVLAVIAGYDPAEPYSRPPEEIPTLAALDTDSIGAFRFGVPADSDLEFFGNIEAEWIYRRALARARALGGTAVTIDFKPFLEAARLLYEGPWLAERMAAVKHIFNKSPNSLLPITQKIIGSAARFSAVDAFEGEYRLRALRRQTELEWTHIDVLLLPTTGTIYTHAEVEAEPIKLNQNLGYYTNFVNLLDLCALAIPSGYQSNGLPAGVTFMAPAGGDELLLAIGTRFEIATRSDQSFAKLNRASVEGAK